MINKTSLVRNLLRIITSVDIGWESLKAIIKLAKEGYRDRGYLR